MTNAEFCIKNGIRFEDLNARRRVYDEKSEICDYEIMNVIETIGAIRTNGKKGGEFALKRWLDLSHYEKPVLDDTEKRYLRAVIRPWRDRVVSISKVVVSYGEFEEIRIRCKNIKPDSMEDFPFYVMDLPVFQYETMYKGMKAGRPYTLYELGL